jgi:hypothetical protein
MKRTPIWFVLAVLALLTGWVLVACGDDDPTSSPTTAAEPTTTVPDTAAPTTAAPTTAAPTTAAPTTATPTTATTTTVAPAPEQPAVWPAADVVIDTPEAAAADFVERVLRVPPVLGPFMAGDSRSGEIEVFSPGEGGPGSSVVRSLLLLRQLGPDDGWFVLGAIEPMVSIDTPAAGATVPAGVVDVRGVARGYEATIIVAAYVAGVPDRITEPVIAMGGALETPEPYQATIDLSGVPSGTVVALVVRGDTGLETDPGEFSAIPVVVA